MVARYVSREIGDGEYGCWVGRDGTSSWYVTTSDASTFGAEGLAGTMNELRKDGKWKFYPVVLELRSGLIESMIMTRPVVR